ncbi:MAG: hemolysin family protein [Burkholderiales bacterium]
MEIIFLLSLILLNSAFAMSEIALVTARKGRLQKLAENGDKSAVTALALCETPTRFLSTIQIGITSIGVLSGIVGEAMLAEPLAQWLEGLGAPRQATGIGATGLVVVVITYTTIVLGELVPKRLGQINPETIARLVAGPMLGLATIAKPFVFLLSASTELILKLLRVKATSAQAVTAEEIRAMLDEGSDAGVIDEQEHEMMRNVFRLDDRQVASLMTPRSEIVYLNVDAPLDENLRKISESDYLRFPVVRGDPGTILGIINAKQILAQTIGGAPLDLMANLQPAVYVPETLTGMELLENFRSSHIQLVVVVDEYGETQGLVTLQDVFEAITGEFKTRSAEDAWALARPDGSWLLDGFIPVPELKDRLELEAVPEEDKSRYHTLSGMIMLLLGRLPRTGDQVQWGGWGFEIVDMDGKRIDKVIATRTVAPRPQLAREQETP